MTEAAPITFLLDVDNTLLDNDAIIANMRAYLQQVLGQDGQASYWKIFEERRENLGYADYLGALQRYRTENIHNANFIQITLFLTNYPFAKHLYLHSLDVITHLRHFGPTVILTDGDVVFQPHKIWRSGLYQAVDGQVLIYIHKELELGYVAERYPAQHYVLVDDKLRILTDVKQVWGPMVTTVFPRQGHYAHDTDKLKDYPSADVTIDHIGELLKFTSADLLAAAQAGQHFALLE